MIFSLWSLIKEALSAQKGKASVRSAVQNLQETIEEARSQISEAGEQLSCDTVPQKLANPEEKSVEYGP